jgi:amphi-Trp domain-containing protein
VAASDGEGDAYPGHAGAQVGKLVVELTLAVGGLAGEQDPFELAGIQGDHGAPPLGAVGPGPQPWPRPRLGWVRDGTGCQGSETQVELMELKEKTTLSREEAASRLHAIADELASNNDVVIEREDIRFVAHVPDQVHLKVEFEIEDDGTELEIELTWKSPER